MKAFIAGFGAAFVILIALTVDDYNDRMADKSCTGEIKTKYGDTVQFSGKLAEVSVN